MADGQVQLASTKWTLVELGGAPVDVGPDEHPPHVVLDLEEAHLSGSGGVNRIMGTARLGYAGVLGRSVLLAAGFALAGAGPPVAGKPEGATLRRLWSTVPNAS